MAKELDCVAVFVGGRANYGRLKFVIKALRNHFKVKVIAGSSALWEQIECDEQVSCLLAGDSTREMALTAGLLHIQLVNILDRLKPKCIVVHGDRYEVLNVAQVAAYMNVPVAHTEGGELTGTIDDKVRYSITALADYHFAVTEQSAERIRKVGREKQVYVVGSTALDNLVDVERKPSDYILALFHPNTTECESVVPMIDALTGQNVVWINPNVDAGNKNILKLVYDAGFKITKQLSPKEYYDLLAGCAVLVGNTSSGIKEGSFLGVPYVCIGHRQKDREHDKNVTFVDNNPWRISEAIFKEYGKTYERSHLFGDGHAGERVAKILKDIC